MGWTKPLAIVIVLLMIGAVIHVYLSTEHEDEEKERPGPDSLVIETPAEPYNLDPADCYDSTGMNLIYNVYETLVSYEGRSNTDFEPILAIEVPTLSNGLISDDGMNYTFNIREGVVFHDGTSLDADDVIYSFERVLRMKQGPSWMLDEVLNLSGIRKLDQYSVRFTLSEPCVHFLHLISHSVSSMVSMETVEANGGIADYDINKWMGENMVGTGPYMLSSWSRGRSITLEAFDGYWGSPPSIKDIRILKVDELSTKVIDLKQGYADVAYIPTTSLDEVTGMQGVVVNEGPLGMVGYFVAMNCQNDPTSDIRIRQAISYCFDYGSMLDGIYDGRGERYVGPWLLEMEGYDETIQPYEQDLSKATDLVNDYKDDHPGSIAIDLVFTDSEISSLLAQQFKYDCEQIGIDVTLQVLSWPLLLQKVDTGEFDCALMGYKADHPHPEGIQAIVESDEIGVANNAWYDDPSVDSMLANASRTTDRGDRIDIYNQVHQEVKEDCPYLWTVQPRTPCVHRDSVHNYAESRHPSLGPYYADVWKTS